MQLMCSVDEQNAFSKIQPSVMMVTKQQQIKTQTSKPGIEGNVFILIRDLYRDCFMVTCLELSF